MYLDKINMLLDTYAPLKRINKYKLKFKSKPWITLGLQKSISVKNKLLTNYINKRDPILKEEFHTKYKIYRNLLSTLMKKSKQAYYKEIGIILRTHGKESYDIANTFNNYFASIAETMKKSINYSHKHFSDYLSNKSSSTIFLEPNNKEERANIISSLNSKKGFWPK